MNIFGKFPIVRLRQIFDNPPYIVHYLLRLFYYKYSSHRFVPKYEGFTFLSAPETLDHLIEHDASLARFSDGDIEQLTGAGEYPPDSDWTQRSSAALRSRLKEVLRTGRDNLLIAHESPKVFLLSREEAKERGVVYNMWTDTRLVLHKFLNRKQVYGHAHVFIPSHHPDLDWQKLYDYLKRKDIVIVTGGTNTLYDISLGRRMFFVETGKHDAFERYAEIRDALGTLISQERLEKADTLIMASLGPTADLLAFDMSKDGWQVWDTGHFFRYTDRQFLSLDEKQRLFTKQLTNRSPEEVRTLFEKCVRLYQASKTIPGLYIPQPLSHTATTIVFERLDIPPSLASSLKSDRLDTDIFRVIGKSLGALHRNVAQKDGRVIVHGDFWTHNIAVLEGNTYFFDTDAPASVDSLQDHHINSRYFDLAAFIVSVELSAAIKDLQRFFDDKTPGIKEFLRAYEKASGVSVDVRELKSFVDDELRRWTSWQVLHGHHGTTVFLKGLVVKARLSRLMVQIKKDL